ncbi:EthD domain-containing protein [Stutzerimonas stutzeri]|uniref:EthD domain-containing protein n=1 Tax=Stutzerimonas stutzeri TaxID=316 RepID=A0A6I6LL46_STUST|nr:EthD domain-containing protein [Stutzerimonas stutzeri]QGZ31178.1 hypothetical protein GQA94_14310 [Stutzerimonas stutzeri]
MASVTTIALLSKKENMSTQLFSRYWRDIHGVLAARIPGFESYVQFHLGTSVRNLPLPKDVVSTASSRTRFHGIAEVTFADEVARAGLASSEVAALIQQDERNLFKTSLLYNLAAGASRTYIERSRKGPGVSGDGKSESLFMLLGRRSGFGGDLTPLIEQSLLPALSRNPCVSKLRIHALASGDPHLWSTPDVDNQQSTANAFDAVIQIEGIGTLETLETLRQACETASRQGLFEAVGKLQLYRTAACHPMVRDKLPTQLGLRGLDALQTIVAAGADNQLQEAILRCLYGTDAAPL